MPPRKGRGTKTPAYTPAPVDGLVGHVTGNAVGPRLFGEPQRLFADPDPGPDETSFHQPNVDEKYYTTGYYFRHQSEIQAFPAPTSTPPRLNLDQILGPNLLQPIIDAKAITFHAVGDTGASTTPLIGSEAQVADAMAADVTRGQQPPAFLYHLGDVVYNFGEGQYYYDQFYEPFRAYDRPIFAIPGNHDGALYGPDVNTPAAPTLEAFLRNFCARAPGPSPDAPSITRTTMTQPGVYFTLDAPCVSIIGLYSNVLEHPGVISSQGGHFALPDDQLTFLAGELARLAPERDALERAIVLAVHHPPVSFDATHGSSPTMANEIDAVCARASVWPDIVLSGHAHLYQRFSRSVQGRSIPYVVAGSGGHLARAPRSDLPPVGADVGNYRLEVEPIFELGYLTLTVDLSSATKPTLEGVFASQAIKPSTDSFVLNLKTGRISSP
ncbi:MAG: metallophosphoesterase family protein [Solirubrobacteraceae bacterium]